MTHRINIAFSIWMLSLSAFAAPNDWVNQKLREFDKNPAEFIANPDNIAKFNPDTFTPIQTAAPQRDVFEKDMMRKRVVDSSEYIGIRAVMDAQNDAKTFVDNFTLGDLKSIENRRLMTGQLSINPWSDDYWPFYTTTIAKRYADRYFPFSKDWRTNANYIVSAHRNQIQNVDILSPAEKYDLLVGDSTWGLTAAMIGDGAAHQRSLGFVQNWMGLCGGWAPASLFVARPAKAIRMVAADGRTEIIFYPSDTKALASLLWDRTPTDTRFLGTRCTNSNPGTDRNGRTLLSQCFDTNPAGLHLALVNQIGISDRGFVMDTTYDYEVWNQPVYAYKYTYFNPQTRVGAATLEQATIPRSQFTNDYFAAHRSPDTVYVTGIAMTVSYVAETAPNHNVTDSAAQDLHKAVQYFYDLEQDANGNIIGGEWYHRQHPDFLWTTVQGFKPRTAGDDELNAMAEAVLWNGNGAVPPAWRNAARTSSRAGQPLTKIVEALVARSQ